MARPGSGQTRFEALAEGIRRCGDEAEIHVMSFKADEPVVPGCYGDVAVGYGIRHEHIVRRCGVRFLVMEMGFLDRNEHYYIGFDGLNGAGEFRTIGGRGRKWQDKLKDYKVKHIGEIRRVLVMGQIPSDSNLYAMRKEAYLEWLRRTVGYCKSRGWETRFRKHPRHTPINNELDGLWDGTSKSLEEDLAWAQMCVGYNSNSLVDAAIAGCAVVPASRMSLTWPIRSSLNTIATPWLTLRKSWLDHVASAQWTVEEMKSGEAWSHLRTIVEPS